MKKIVPALLIVWLIIGITSFAVWWKVVRNINTENVLAGANEIAREMEIPWAIRFSDVKPGYGAEFSLKLLDLVVLNDKGEVLLKSVSSEVRIPWAVFFKKSPVKINIFLKGIEIPSTKELILEFEQFVDSKKQKPVTELSLPEYILNSTFNLRISDIKGDHAGKFFKIDKFYLINADPKKPTTFEISFPWEKIIRNNTISVTTKLLGEYRLSRQKIDIHYFAKNRLNIKSAEIDKNAEITFEGKAYYGSRIGFFSTLASKEDWLGFVGDLEWTKESFRVNFPKISVNHDLLFDLYSVKNLQSQSKGYSQNTIQGDWRVEKKGDAPLRSHITFQSKSSAKVSINGNQQSLFMKSSKTKRKKDFLIKIDDKEILVFNMKKGVGEYKIDPSFLSSSDLVGEKIYSALTFLDWLDWESLSVSQNAQKWFEVAKVDKAFSISELQIKDLPPIKLTLKDDQILEWSTQTVSQPLDSIFNEFNLNHFGIPGFRYDSTILARPNHLKLKSSWKGNILPIFSKSSCRALLQERSELFFLFQEDLNHSVEFEKEIEKFKIISWNAVSPGKKITINGHWSNDPIKCQLIITEQTKNKKKE